MKQDELTNIALSYRNIIWDVDGTLLDSMGVWKTLAGEYVRSLGLPVPEDLDNAVASMTMEGAAAYIQVHVLPERSVPEILAGVKDTLANEYRNVLSEKKPAADILLRAGSAGISMAVLTTGDRELVEAALSRLGMRQYLKAVITADELQMDKHSPAIYVRTMEILNFDPRATLICEDSLYAVRSAAGSGAKVMAFRDAENISDWEEICQLADYISS